MTHNDRYQAILSLRALRNYSVDPIPDATLAAILEAARWTGSSKNRQKWAFVVVTDPQLRDRLAECGDFTDPMRNAPVSIALVQEPEGYEFDTGRVAQNIMLAADALGVSTCPLTLHREEDAAVVLGLPEGARARYAVAMGLPGPGSGPMRWGGRKPRDEVVYWNRHGNSNRT
jgi:nitroreductase